MTMCVSASRSRLVPQELPRLPSVVEGLRPGSFERARRRDAHERLLLRPARERLAHDRRPRARPGSAAGSGRPRGDRRRGSSPCRSCRPRSRGCRRRSGTRPRARARTRRAGIARAEQARGLEELPRLQRDAREVGVDRRLGIVALLLLHRLAACDREAGAREDVHALEVAASASSAIARRTGSRPPARAAGAPYSCHADERPRRSSAPSIRSSWTSVATCASSIATPARRAARGRSR